MSSRHRTMELRLCPRCEHIVTERTSCPECEGPVQLANPEFFLGHTFGKYTIEKVLGHGGMGVVYLAKHRTLLRRDALKLLLTAEDGAPSRRRFLREARVLAELRHPNIVEVYDFDVNDWRIPYLVMEYLEGQTLRELVSHRGRLTWPEIRTILFEVASGLASIHGHHIVHRDLKPENVFLARYDSGIVAKVLDFGIAKAFGDRGFKTHLTESGLVVGTLSYLAPEQILEDELSPATDQYALALVAAELLTGAAVRSGLTLARIISDEIKKPVCIAPELPPDVHPGLSAVIERATCPDPGDRFADVQTFVEALDEAAGNPIHASGEYTLELANTGPLSSTDRQRTLFDRGRPRPQTTRPSRTRRRLVPWVAAAIAILTALGVVLTVDWRDEGPAFDAGASDLRLVEEVVTPLDSQEIVVMTDEAVVLRGIKDLVLASRQPGRPPTRMSITPESVLGTSLDGDLVLKLGTTSVIRNPTGTEEIPWADNVPDGVVGSSPDTRWLTIPTDKGLSIYKVSELRYRHVRDIELESTLRGHVVGTRLLAVVDGTMLKVFNLESGHLELRRDFTESSVTSMAIHDDSSTVAVGGWFDHVLVVDVEQQTTTRIPRREGADEAIDLEFLLAGPRLAVAEKGGVSLVDLDGESVGQWNRPDATISDVAYHQGHLLALDTDNHTVAVLQLPGIKSERVLSAANDEPWAAAADPTASRILLGNADGNLDVVNLEDGDVDHVRVHTLGITSLVCDGAHLATASDDKTIAVWKLPELTVEWRSRAHDYLVNQLFLDPSGKELWSTSSDRSLKRWSWPSLELRETVRTADVLGTPYSLAALWVSRDRRTVLLGTWDRAALVLERADDGTWSGVAHPFDPWGGYVIAALEPVDAAVLSGINHPYALAVLDLRDHRFVRLRGANQAARCVVAVDDGHRVLAFADRRILDYRFRRGDNGELWYEMAAAHHPTLGVAGAATLLDENRVAVANAAGEVHILDVGAIDPPVLCDVRVGDP